jgi:septal ring factor EnvC (AmiA/AmiB activator)
MCKKVLIAAVAVVVALAVVKGTWLGSHIRLWRQNLQTAIHNRIPPEQEIQRLRMELENLSREDEKFFDQVARQSVQVKKIENQVAQVKKDLAERENRIRALKTSLTGEGQYVTVNGEQYRRELVKTDLRTSAAAFQVEEERLHSLEGQLAAKRQVYDLNKKKLSELKLARQQMLTELQRLETALAEERQAQAQEAGTLDDASYLKIRKDMDSVRDKIEFLKTKRQLKSEVRGPVRAAEERKEENTKIDNFIENRFGEKADKQ